MAELNIKLIHSERVIFPEGQQKYFLQRAQLILGLDSKSFSSLAGVHARSMTDWKREKYSMSFDGLKRICYKAKVMLPDNIQLKDPFWYVNKGSKLGGLASYSKYGRIGGNEEYRKGRWYEWWNREGKLRKNSIVSCLPIKIPPNSSELSELVGIVLGDGGITKGQLSITLNRFDDKDFSIYVRNLLENLFRVKSSVYERESVVNVVISRTELVKYMLSMGLKIGNKVKQQVEVPQWIKKSRDFSRSCIRGLFDTDGCFYVDRHKYQGKVYLNSGMNFTNRSLPILNFFKESLINFGFHPTQKTPFSIFLRVEKEIIRYFKEIGSSNPKHINKFNNYLNHKLGEVPKWT